MSAARYNIYKFFFAFFVSVFLITISLGYPQEELSGQQIVKLSDDLMRGETQRGRWVMTITTPNWTRRLELDIWAEGRDKNFIRILSPAKEEGTGTLRIKYNMWNYLPSIERTMKIPPSMMLQSWMGSDFANDDLVKESSIVYDYTHTVIGEESIEGSIVYRIEAIPKPDAPVTWGKLVFLIRKSDYIPVRVEYFNERGRLIKALDYSALKKMSDRVVPTLWKMTPMNKEGCQTVLEAFDIIYNQSIDGEIFTLENLKRTK